jgi:hypothetical protein
MAAMVYKWFMVCSLWLAAGISHPSASAPAKNKTGGYHPFYISVTEINLNTSDKTLEVSCKMFADDLEQIIEKNNKTELDISLDKYKASFDKYIPDYVHKHLSLSVDGHPATLSYIGFEKDKESAFCYFQVNGISSVKKIDITNSLLHDFISDQINIMHVTVNGKRQSTKLDYPDTNASFSF